jgi:tetratricopeptide (TPR) repeat protein
MILKQRKDSDAFDQAFNQAKSLKLPLDLLEQISRSLVVPPHKRVDSLVEILKQNNAINTEIAARLFIENYPEHPLGWQILGEVLHDSGKLEEALEIKRLAIEKFPKDANVYNNVARTLFAMQDYEGTRANAEKALKLDPTHTNATHHLSIAKRILERQDVQRYESTT